MHADVAARATKDKATLATRATGTEAAAAAVMAVAMGMAAAAVAVEGAGTAVCVLPIPRRTPRRTSLRAARSLGYAPSR